MNCYYNLLEEILTRGQTREGRNGATLSLYAPDPLRFGLRHGFPLLTARKLHWRSIVYELLWFLRGDTNIKYLNENGVTIWDEWADGDGWLGPVYGMQWRGGIGRWRDNDQIYRAINILKTEQNSRRILVDSWNVSRLNEMALPPCHYAFQFWAAHNRLSCTVVMRSADAFIGLPFNIASYALITHMIAQVTGMEVSQLVITFTGDAHLYANHIDQARELLIRRYQAPTLPTLSLEPLDNIDDFDFHHIHLHDYNPLPHIKAEVSK